MVKCHFNFQNTYLQQVPKFMKRYYEIDLKHFVTSSSVKPSPENFFCPATLQKVTCRCPIRSHLLDSYR